MTHLNRRQTLGLIGAAIALAVVELVRQAAWIYVGDDASALLDMVAAHPLSFQASGLVVLVGILDHLEHQLTRAFRRFGSFTSV